MAKKNKLPALYESNDFMRAMKIEKSRLSGRVKFLEQYFDKGMCGLAFCFEGGNANYMRKVAKSFVKDFAETGRLHPREKEEGEELDG